MQSSTHKQRAGIILTTTVSILTVSAMAQDLYPLSLEEKVKGAKHIVLARMGTNESYVTVGDNLYTLHTIDVLAALGKKLPQRLYVITPGGLADTRATVVYPSIQLQGGSDYILFLEEDNHVFDNKALRAQNKKTPQCPIWGYPQGAMPYDGGVFTAVGMGRMSEAQMLAALAKEAGAGWLTPEGKTFAPRPARAAQTNAVSSFGPNPTRAGTIKPADYLTITGTGFGAAPGFVAFANADDGGASRITPPANSDYVSWSDAQIVVKVPTRAGTGSFTVNNTFTSPSPLTVQYALIDIYSSFLNFPTATRQLPHLVNKNNLGGYTFRYNTTSGFAANTAATAAFERALTTWRAGTGVNFRSGGTTTAVNANDGANTVTFGTLSAGVLAQTLTNYSGSGIGGTCDRQNTVWWINDIDMVFATRPNSSTTWQYGPAAPSFSQYDFESVALHELGHAHNLGHVIAPGQVMHYAISNGQVSRTLSSNDIAAGQEMMQWSATLCFRPSGVLGPMTPAPATLRMPEWTTLPVVNKGGLWLAGRKLVVQLGEATEGLLYLYTIDGRLLLQQKLQTAASAIDLPATARGALWYRLRTGKAEQNGRLVVQ